MYSIFGAHLRLPQAIRVIPAAQPITTAWQPKVTTAPARNDAARTAPEHLVGETNGGFFVEHWNSCYFCWRESEKQEHKPIKHVCLTKIVNFSSWPGLRRHYQYFVCFGLLFQRSSTSTAKKVRQCFFLLWGLTLDAKKIVGLVRLPADFLNFVSVS